LQVRQGCLHTVNSLAPAVLIIACAAANATSVHLCLAGAE
jgi:hypothetical protein